METAIEIGHIVFQAAVLIWGWFLWVKVEHLTDQLEAARKTVRELVLVTVFNSTRRDKPLDDVEAELPWEKLPNKLEKTT